MIEGQLKTCSRCGVQHPRTNEFFRRQKSCKDGLMPHCKACALQREYQWRQNNPEKYREQSRRKFKRDKEKINARNREWNRCNYEQVAIAKAKWNLANRERIKEVKKEYFQNNRERYRTYTRNRRALERQADGTHNSAELERMYTDQSALCAYCAVALEGRYHVDHMVPIIRGGSNDWENLALTCAECNWSKNRKTAEEFIAWKSKEAFVG